METKHNAELVKNTEFSITSYNKLLTELKMVAERGYALDMQEYSIGVGCIAVPIFNYTGKCIASIGITGNYNEYLEEKNIQRFYEILKHAANEISSQMGYNY